MVVWYVRILFGWNTRFSTSNQSSSNKETTTYDCRCALAVHANCLRTANLLFVEVIHLGFQKQKRLIISHYLDALAVLHSPNLNSIFEIHSLEANTSILCVQKHDLCVQIDALARLLCVQNHDLCILDAMTRSGYNTARSK